MLTSDVGLSDVWRVSDVCCVHRA